jgi:hypothetical protein
MLSNIITPLLTLSALLTTTSAFPSRTHCLCTIVDANAARFLPESLPNSEDPSIIPSEYTSAAQSDICTNLGPELESLRDAKPDQYADFISHALTTTISQDASSTAEQRPISTTILLQLSAQNSFANLGAVLPSEPPAPSQQRIVCRTEVQGVPAYQNSLITLFVVQVIIGLAILACVAECVTLALRWYVPRTPPRPRPNLHVLTSLPRMSRSNNEHVPERPALRLSGEEKRLLAIPEEQVIFSPGVDKKQRSYRNGTWTPRLSSGRKEFEAYVVEEDDDELSRPVM